MVWAQLTFDRLNRSMGWLMVGWLADRMIDGLEVDQLLGLFVDCCLLYLAHLMCVVWRQEGHLASKNKSLHHSNWVATLIRVKALNCGNSPTQCWAWKQRTLNVDDQMMIDCLFFGDVIMFRLLVEWRITICISLFIDWLNDWPTGWLIE